MPKFGTKNALFGFFWARIKKNIVRCKISTIKFVYFQNFMRKQKCLNLEPKMPDLCTFGLEFENKHPWICQIVKFRDETKTPKFGTKRALIELFWAIILKNYCHIWNQHLRISLRENSVKKRKCLNLGRKMPYFSIFDQKCLIWVFLGKN